MKTTAADERHYLAEWHFTDLLDTSTDVIHAFGSTIARPNEMRFSTQDHIQTYVDHVMGHPSVTSRMGLNRVDVVINDRLRRHAYARGNQIVLPRKAWAWRESVVLHECAHILSPTDHDHGSLFASRLIDLVSTHMGTEAAWLMGCLINETTQRKQVSA
jgi:putative metallohydrolase (TIGR04338 family)